MPVDSDQSTLRSPNPGLRVSPRVHPSAPAHSAAASSRKSFYANLLRHKKLEKIWIQKQ